MLAEEQGLSSAGAVGEPRQRGRAHPSKFAPYLSKRMLPCSVSSSNSALGHHRGA